MSVKILVLCIELAKLRKYGKKVMQELCFLPFSAQEKYLVLSET
jgi:hypothetical protein